MKRWQTNSTGLLAAASAFWVLLGALLVLTGFLLITGQDFGLPLSLASIGMTTYFSVYAIYRK
ncbi:hypothetical protein [Loigolactobacillus binensis]|uniref:Uncharacterized protein n=1 Tax=Loigolactobacillus binensis TaxID=2559922 RepID=A0ABW3ED85_9LACO|nr:hypothetical protein [Loigolactobacillus binensis]